MNDPGLNLRDLDAVGLTEALGPLGVPPAVARRVFSRVHRHGASRFDDVPGLSRAARAAVDRATVWPELEVVERRQGSDGLLKYLLKLPDGLLVEAVRIPLPDPAATRALRERRGPGPAPLVALPAAKYTVCVSSQVGCALACSFCATGRLGALRSLRTWEILAQVRAVAADADHPVRGVVFMGMGEPFLNYENVIRAARILSDPAGPAIDGAAITISTAGVVPQIRRYTADGHRFRLVFSLGAPTAEGRRRLMPIEDRWPLDELVEAIREHAEATRQRATIAYVAIGGAGGTVTPEHGRRLVALLAGIRVRINLIDVTDASGLHPRATDAELGAFREALAPLRAPVVRRYSGGADIGAACGTLAATRTGGTALAGPVSVSE